MDLKLKCFKCKKYFEVDSWYAKEVEEGREEAVCKKCKDKLDKDDE
jgi:hypothetical protein